MSTHRRPATTRMRFPAGVLAAALLAALGVSFLFAGSARSSAEEDAEARAARYVTDALVPELTPEMVAEDIVGADYRVLLIAAQEGILDDRITEARIWTPDGDLIFSTAERDAIDSVVATGNDQIAAAADGETVSLVTEAEIAARSGLDATREEVLQTFVPLRLTDDVAATAVAQIDTRYSSIEEEADRVWRPVQIALIVALGIVVVILGLSLRSEEEPEQIPARPRSVATPSVARSTSVDARLRDAEARAASAERAAREAESRLAAAERRLSEAGATSVPATVRSRLD
ncbi:MAG TPA: hypothetical protein VEC09_03455, partial [Actinomycetota bacterium]|nr:hypothetical protein [Actinomycetota bacterium]